MKKLIIFVIAITFYSCVDYGCSTSYVVENKTTTGVVVGRYSVAVKSGEKKTVDVSGHMCGKKTIPQDYYYDGEGYSDRPVFPLNIIVDDEFLRNVLIYRKYLTYSHEKYYRDTYTLVLTDEVWAEILAEPENNPDNELDPESE